MKHSPRYNTFCATIPYMLYKFKRIEIILNMLSDHSRLKLQINNIKQAGKSPNPWKLNKTFLRAHGSKKKSQR